MEHIRKLRHNVVLNDNPTSFSRYEFAVVEALHVLGLSRHLPGIEQYSLSLMLGNSLKQLKESLFGIFQRELSACLYAEKARLKMHLLL